jgi:hypothetical protein
MTITKKCVRARLIRDGVFVLVGKSCRPKERNHDAVAAPDDPVHGLARAAMHVWRGRARLHLLVSRARQCQCGPEQRELGALAPGAADAPRRSVEVDAYVRASLVPEARRIADAGGPHLNQHQVLRVMLMRAARCRCGETSLMSTAAGASVSPRGEAI